MLSQTELPQPPRLHENRFYDWLVAFWQAFSNRFGQYPFPATVNQSSDANTLDDYEEGNTAPTPSAGGGAFTTATAAVRYTKIGNRVQFTATVAITTNGTANAYVLCPLPFSGAETTAIAGADGNAGFALFGYVTGSNVLIKKYDGTYPGGNGVTLIISGTYRTTS